MTAAELAGPVTKAKRIESLDVIRGFALLGILIVNIQAFSMISAAYFNPTAYGDLTGMNYAAWMFTHVFADQKFMTIFAMLFGAGIVLMAQRAEAAGGRPAAIHYRRIFFLILFGIVHAYFLFYGDILVIYGLSALFVFLFWRRSWVTLIIAGLVLLLIGTGLFVSTGLSMDSWPVEARQDFYDSLAPPAEKAARELAAYRGDLFAQMEHRTPYVFEFQTSTFLFWGFWRAAGVMLLGMGLFKLGLFQIKDPKRFAIPALGVAIFVGLPLILYGVYQNTLHDWDPGYTFWFGGMFNYWGSILISLGYIGLVMWLMTFNFFKSFAARLAAVGQSALSNYILQSIICAWIFYGFSFGLGLFGSVERTGQILIVLGIWIIQLIVSPLWMARFRFGPLEWLWRSLTYWRRQPLKR